MGVVARLLGNSGVSFGLYFKMQHSIRQRLRRAGSGTPALLRWKHSLSWPRDGNMCKTHLERSTLPLEGPARLSSDRDSALDICPLRNRLRCTDQRPVSEREPRGQGDMSRLSCWDPASGRRLFSMSCHKRRAGQAKLLVIGLYLCLLLGCRKDFLAFASRVPQNCPSRRPSILPFAAPSFLPLRNKWLQIRVCPLVAAPSEPSADQRTRWRAPGISSTGTRHACRRP